MRDYKIRRVRNDDKTRLVCEARSLDDPEVWDQINEFPDTPSGLEAAKKYVLETSWRNRALMDEA